MTEQEMAAERYLWLREGKTRWRSMAPFVINQRRSRLYAVEDSRGDVLDVEIDVDIYNNKLQDLDDANEIVERGLMPAGACRHDFEGPYVVALEKLTQEVLGWDDARVAAVMAAQAQ